MSKGQQIPILDEIINSEDSAISNDTLFHVVRAEEGLVLPQDNLQMVEFITTSLSKRFGQKGNIRSQQLSGEGHGFQDSFPLMQEIVGDLMLAKK